MRQRYLDSNPKGFSSTRPSTCLRQCLLRCLHFSGIYHKEQQTRGVTEQQKFLSHYPEGWNSVTEKQLGWMTSLPGPRTCVVSGTLRIPFIGELIPKMGALHSNLTNTIAFRVRISSWGRVTQNTNIQTRE